MSDSTETPEPDPQGEPDQDGKSPASQGDAKKEESQGEPASEETPEPDDDDLSGLKNKVGQLLGTNKKLKEDLTKLKAAEEERARKEAEEKGEFERLYKAETTKVKEQEKELADLKAKEEKRLDAVSKSVDRSLKELSPEEKEKFKRLFGDIDNADQRREKLDLFLSDVLSRKETPRASNRVPASPDKTSHKDKDYAEAMALTDPVERQAAMKRYTNKYLK